MDPLSIVFVGTDGPQGWTEQVVGTDRDSAGGCRDVVFRPPRPLPRGEALVWARRVLDKLIQRPAEVIAGRCGIRLRLRPRMVDVEDHPVWLTRREFDLLRLLLERQDEVLTADEIANEVWGHETFGSRNFVESQVSRLRRKLAAAGAPGVITTLRGTGYVIRSELGQRRAETAFPPVPPRTIGA